MIYVLLYLKHRFCRLPTRPLRVHRLLAALAGRRTLYVDCIPFTLQLAAATMPMWQLILNLQEAYEPGKSPILDDPVLLGSQTGFFSYFLCNIGGRRRLKSAEFVLLNGRSAFFKVGDYTAKAKTVCRHSGYQEPKWNFRGMRGAFGDEPRSRGCYWNSGVPLRVGGWKIANAES